MPDAFEDRATVLEAPRVLPFGDRVGRFCVIRGEEPPPADESDDGDDVVLTNSSRHPSGVSAELNYF